MSFLQPPADPRPAWVAIGHTWEVEPMWLLLPSSFRPICDSCGHCADQEHDVEHGPTAPRQQPARQFRYGEND